jgi:uncharacterized protein YciW
VVKVDSARLQDRLVDRVAVELEAGFRRTVGLEHLDRATLAATATGRQTTTLAAVAAQVLSAATQAQTAALVAQVWHRPSLAHR